MRHKASLVAIEVLVVTLLVLLLEQGGMADPSTLTAAVTDTEHMSRHVPQVCIGANSDGSLGLSSRQVIAEGTEFTCPRGYAFLGANSRYSGRYPPRAVPVSGVCCPLPSNDILLDEHQYADELCPKHYVATGTDSRRPCRKSWNRLTGATECASDEGYFLRCTKINSARYSLSPMHSGVFWGFATNASKEVNWIKRADIPAANVIAPDDQDVRLLAGVLKLRFVGRDLFRSNLSRDADEFDL